MPLIATSSDAALLAAIETVIAEHQATRPWPHDDALCREQLARKIEMAKDLGYALQDLINVLFWVEWSVSTGFVHPKVPRFAAAEHASFRFIGAVIDAIQAGKSRALLPGEIVGVRVEFLKHEAA